MTHKAQAFNDVAVFIEIHIAVGRGRSGFAIVDKRIFAVHADQHEAATANVACLRISDRERQPCCNACVYGISAGRQYVLGDLGAIAIGHGNCRIGTGYRCGFCRCRGCGSGARLGFAFGRRTGNECAKQRDTGEGRKLS